MPDPCTRNDRPAQRAARPLCVSGLDDDPTAMTQPLPAPLPGQLHRLQLCFAGACLCIAASYLLAAGAPGFKAPTALAGCLFLVTFALIGGHLWLLYRIAARLGRDGARWLLAIVALPLAARLTGHDNLYTLVVLPAALWAAAHVMVVLAARGRIARRVGAQLLR